MSPARILIVEDEAIVARDIAQQLAVLGYEPVAQTPRGEQAIDLAEQLRPDLVLMDIQLAGEMDGIATAQAIRERLAIPVVFLTAFVGDATLERAKVAEPFGYIIKPFQGRELRAVIEMVLCKHKAETRLRNSQEELTAILRTAMDGFWIVDAGGRFQEVNDAYCQLTGYSREELLRMVIHDLEVDETPDQIAATMQRIQRLGSARFERRQRCKDGRVVHVEANASYLPGVGRRFICFFRDITERKAREQEIERLNRLYSALSMLNQTIVRVKSREELFREVCRIVAEKADFKVVWVGWVDPKTHAVNPVACAGDDEGYLDKIEVYADDRPEGRGPVGACIREDRTIVFNDFLRDPRAAPWHAAAAAHGLRAATALPIRFHGEVCGALTVYTDELCIFQDKEVALLEEATSAVSFALESLDRESQRKRSEEALREERDYTQSIIHSMADMLVVVAPDGRIATVNEAICESLGYPEHELLGQPATLLFEEEEDIDQSILSQLPLPVKRTVLRHLVKRGSVTNVEKSLRTKRGTPMPVLFSGSVMWDDDGGIRGIVCLALDITDRKRAEGELRWKTAFLEAQVNSCLDGILVVDDQGKKLLINQRLIELWEIPRHILDDPDDETLLKHVVSMVTHPEEFYERVVSLYSHPSETSRDEIEFISGMVLDRYSSPVLGERGQYYGRIWTFRDITERKRAEETLRDSEERFRSVVETSPSGITVLDLSGRILLSNQQLAWSFGFDNADAFLSEVKTCFDVLSPEDHQRARDDIARATALGILRDLRYWLVRRDGSRFPADVSVSLQRDAKDGPKVLTLLLQDVTERERAREALQKSEDRWRTSIELTGQVAWTTDGAGMVVEDVPHWYKYTGQSCEETKGLGWAKALHPDDFDRTVQVWKQAVEAKSAYETEYRLRRFDGVYRHFLTRGVPVFREDRSIREWIGVCIDITERKSAEVDLRVINARLEEEVARAESLAVQAEAANRAKSEFLANMSHEIRTPMTAILGFSELLTTANLPPDEQSELVTGIQRNGKVLLELINDILDLSRIEADRLTLDRVDCPLRQIIDDVLSVVQLRAEQKGLGLEVDYAFPLPETVHTDPIRLRQVLTNLVGNAVKFTEHGAVRVCLRCTRVTDGSARMQFAISDTGIGIPAEKMHDLFQPFTQVDGSATRRYGGTGLGLAISRRLAEALGGDIQVSSQLGEGSTFTLTIDAGSLESVRMLQSVRAFSTVEEPSSPIEHKAPLHGRVLVVEDVPDVCTVLHHILQRLNLELEIAEDGRLACEMAEESQAKGRPYDLILMDIQMPKMNGYEATRWLREHGWKGPIVALTAHALVGDCEKCLEAGCDGYMAKPITAKGLRDVLTQYLGQAAVGEGCLTNIPETVRESAGLLQSGILDPGKVRTLMDAFCEELLTRAGRIDEALQERNRTLLLELTHQLKGTAGLYGFDTISKTAHTICDRLWADDELEELEATVYELVDLCRKAASQQPGNCSDKRAHH